MKYFIFLSLLFSCTKYHKVEEGNGIFLIKDLKPEIQSYKIVDWQIGKSKDATVSQGFRFVTTTPKIEKEGLEKLHKKYGIDGYIFRVLKLSKGKLTPIGHVYMAFRNMTRTTESFTLTVYYAAAAISKQFRSFRCPAFNHRLIIADSDLNMGTRSTPVNTFIKPVERVRTKVSKLAFVPQSFNGGLELYGKYYIDVALYSTAKKHRYSSWIPVDGEIDISDERAIKVSSCLGVKEELNALPESRLPTLQDLQIR